jgi:hypothetical protein
MLAGAVVVCELWRLVVALWLLVFSSRVHKWSINAFTNPNPFYSHPSLDNTYIHTYIHTHSILKRAFCISKG